MVRRGMVPCSFAGRKVAMDRRLLAASGEERLRRWSKRSIGYWLTVPQIPVLLLASVAFVFTVMNDREDRHVASLLEHDGVDVEGSAIHFQVRLAKGELLFGDRVEVAFKAADGRNVTTWIPNGITVELVDELGIERRLAVGITTRWPCTRSR